jgi:protein tyrosine/serine phosphatase
MIEKNVIEVMSLLSHTENGPFLIHCLHGSNRTGLMSAMYRILVEKWEPELAIDEMVHGGYGFNTKGYTNFIEYIKSLKPKDIEKLQAAIKAKRTMPDKQVEHTR